MDTSGQASAVAKLLAEGGLVATGQAAGHLVRRAFQEEWLERILAVVAAGNTASKRVLQKIGMRPVASPDPLGRKELEYFRIDAPRHFEESK